MGKSYRQPDDGHVVPFVDLRAQYLAIKAEIDEAAWSSLYSTVSRPFDPPKSGMIAVKVINHYGDEAMRVLQVTS